MKRLLPLFTGILTSLFPVLEIAAQPMAPLPSDTLAVQDNRFQTVITAEEIRESGITRLHELFTLMDHWSGYSINGQDFHAAATGLSPYEGAGWTLLVDEQQVDVRILNWQQLNQAPVSLQQIEKVIVIEHPQLYQGHFTDRGLIHIITGKSREGWLAEGRLMTGNEVHDPGPYEFTDRRTPNAERVGPDMDLLLGYRGTNWFFHGSLSTLVHRTTDTPIEQRIKAMLFTGPPEPLFEAPEANRRAGYLRGGYRGEAGTLTLQAGLTRQRDILFFRPYGRDLPVELENRFLGASGEVSMGEHSTLSFRSAWQDGTPGYAPNRENLNLQFQTTRWSHQFGWSRETESRQFEIGTRLESTRATGLFQQETKPQSVWHYYHKWHESIHNNLYTVWDFQMSSDNNSRAVKSTLSAVWRLNPNQWLRPSLSYSERLPSESPGFWFWAGKGYTLLSNLDISYEPLPEIRSSTLLSAGLEWQVEMSDALSIQLGSYLRQYQGVLLSGQEYHLIRPHQWFEHSGVTVHPDGEAVSAGLHTRIHLHSGETLRHMLFLGARKILSGTVPMRRAFGEIPTRRLRFTTAWEPVSGFELWAGLRVQSPGIWSDFERVDGESYSDQQELVEGRYRMKTGPVTILDMGGRKSLWNNRLHLSLFIKNLLNQSYVEYPVGAEDDLTFYLQLELRL